MASKKDILALLPEQLRVAVLRHFTHGLFGDDVGGELWKQLEPGFTTKLRQPGDAADPEQNFWRGAWRIYDAD
jgi:hypothetical protein